LWAEGNVFQTKEQPVKTLKYKKSNVNYTLTYMLPVTNVGHSRHKPMS